MPANSPPTRAEGVPRERVEQDVLALSLPLSLHATFSDLHTADGISSDDMTWSFRKHLLLSANITAITSYTRCFCGDRKSGTTAKPRRLLS
ncbi:hypothetical protein BaRGS_00014066 [Batillaria attramentaria]|uniref:Uncharacterized protein n=1 Tax=Batillaria attramentaria TaxID=370345 RepID=A0ABD0L5U5_9CAEN